MSHPRQRQAELGCCLHEPFIFGALRAGAGCGAAQAARALGLLPRMQAGGVLQQALGCLGLGRGYAGGSFARLQTLLLCTAVSVQSMGSKAEIPASCLWLAHVCSEPGRQPPACLHCMLVPSWCPADKHLCIYLLGPRCGRASTLRVGRSSCSSCMDAARSAACRSSFLDSHSAT